MKPMKPAPLSPATRRRPPIREQLQTAINANITRTVEEGLKGIDALAERQLRRLERQGITGIRELGGSVAQLAKELLVKGISR